MRQISFSEISGIEDDHKMGLFVQKQWETTSYYRKYLSLDWLNTNKTMGREKITCFANVLQQPFTLNGLFPAASFYPS